MGMGRSLVLVLACWELWGPYDGFKSGRFFGGLKGEGEWWGWTTEEGGADQEEIILLCGGWRIIRRPKGICFWLSVDIL